MLIMFQKIEKLKENKKKWSERQDKIYQETEKYSREISLKIQELDITNVPPEVAISKMQSVLQEVDNLADFVKTKDKEINIIPTIIADSFLRNTKRKKEFDEACDKFKSTKVGSLFGATICPVEYISFERTNKEIIFKRIFLSLLSQRAFFRIERTIH